MEPRCFAPGAVSGKPDGCRGAARQGPEVASGAGKSASATFPLGDEKGQWIQWFTMWVKEHKVRALSKKRQGVTGL